SLWLKYPPGDGSDRRRIAPLGFMNTLLDNALRRGIQKGRLRVIYADGTTRTYGSAGADEVAIRFRDREAEWALTVDPALKLGELYMAGRLVIEAGNCYELISTVKRNARRIATAPGAAVHALRYATAFAAQRQTLA